MAKTFIKDDPITRDTIATRKEYEMFQEKRKRLGDQLVEKWNRTKYGKLDKLYSINPTKARNTAIALENTHRELTILKENGVIATTLFNTQPENVLKVVRIGVANRNRGDIFDEYQLLSMYDALYFINRVVGTSNRTASNLNQPDKLIYEAGISELLEGSEISWGDKSVDFDSIGNNSVEIDIPETPIVPYTIKVYVDGVGYIGTDDGNGRFVSQPLSITSGERTSYLDTEKSEVDYSTGKVKLYFNSGITGTHKVVVEGNYNSELREGRDKFQKISLRIEKRNWRPRPYPIQWEFSQMLTLFFRNPQFGNVGDVSDMLVKAAGDEHAIRADLRALQEAKRVADLNPKYKFDADYTGKSDNDFNHAQRVYTVIQNIVGQIYNELGRGGVVSIVATPTVANYLAKHHKFNEDNTQPRVSGTFLFGTIGSIKIYQTRADKTQGILKETIGSNGINGECLVICKNMEDVGEPSIAWGVLAELSAALDYPELYRSGVLATVEDRIIVQPKFIRKLSIENIRDLEVQ
jgi:hypothetical protein